MNTVFIILIMILIGALIGGMTNFLAIKMLFRPYEPVYLGNWRLPFTPGLIPKRRSELAEQLGRVVTDYLVTSDALENKVLDNEFQQKIVLMVNHQIDDMLEEEYSVLEMIQKINPDFNVKDLEKNVETFISIQLKSMYETNKNQSINDLLPQNVTNAVESHLPHFTAYVIDQIEQYLMSEEGKQKISESASKFLKTQGFLGNMVSSYLGEEGLAGKITPAISMFLSSRETHQSIEKILNKEWEKLKEKDLDSIREIVEAEDLEHNIANFITKELNFQAYLDQPVGKVLGDKVSQFKDHWLPKIVDIAFQKLSTQMPVLLEQLNLHELVKKEVETFDVSRIERLVLEITKREMNMITYLGALLGGIIGLIQGLIVLFIA